MDSVIPKYSGLLTDAQVKYIMLVLSSITHQIPKMSVRSSWSIQLVQTHQILKMFYKVCKVDVKRGHANSEIAIFAHLATSIAVL